MSFEQAIDRTFIKEELLDHGLPDEPPDGGAIVEDRILSVSRWSVHHRLVFRLPGQPENEAWEVAYSVGATETQMERPWQYEERIKARLVHRVTRPMEVWEAKKHLAKADTQTTVCPTLTEEEAETLIFALRARPPFDGDGDLLRKLRAIKHASRNAASEAQPAETAVIDGGDS